MVATSKGQGCFIGRLFRRAGLLRVKTLADLFAAAETLSRVPRLQGERLAILTNGGGAEIHLAGLPVPLGAWILSTPPMVNTAGRVVSS